MLEGGHDAGGGECPALGRDTRYRIKADRTFRIGHVQIAYVVDARARDGVENVEREVAVGINYRDALSPADIPHRQIEQESTFTAAGFPDDIDMPLALLARK